MRTTSPWLAIAFPLLLAGRVAAGAGPAPGEGAVPQPSGRDKDRAVQRAQAAPARPSAPSAAAPSPPANSAAPAPPLPMSAIPGASPPAAGLGSGTAPANPYAAPTPGNAYAAATGAGSGSAPGGMGMPGGGFGTLAGTSVGATPQMLGDQGANVTIRQTTGTPAAPGLPQPFPPAKFPKPPNPSLASSLVPSVRGFKIAENQSPLPQDRFFFSYNYFSNLNAALNRRFDAPVDHLRVYREIFGVEKTFDQGRGSVGMILPIQTLSANSTVRGSFAKPGGTSTALGDLSLFTKYVLKYDPATGSLISAGLVVTPPTGPNHFAGATYLQTVHATSVQPFLGYILRRERFYLHGFAAMDTPSSVRDVTMVYNDLGIGYFVYRNADPTRFLTAIAPTFEVHVNTPLTHRDPFNSKDPTGTPDVVNLTYGLNLEFHKRSVLTVGFVTPVTGPLPFDYEFLLLFNVFFGGSRNAPRSTLPILGG